MALIEIYAGYPKTVPLQFSTYPEGSPINVSGVEIRGVAKRNYSDSNSQAIINKVVTGIDGNAVTGLVYFPFTSGDTTQCAGNYLLDFFATLSGTPSPFHTDGLSIIPTTYY